MTGLGAPFSSTDQFGWTTDSSGRVDYSSLMGRNTSPVPTSIGGGGVIGAGVIGTGLQSSMMTSAVGKQPTSVLFPQQLSAPGSSSQPDQQRGASKLFDHSADFSDGLLSSGAAVGSPSSNTAYMRQMSAAGKLQSSGGSGIIGGVGSRLTGSGVPPGTGLGLSGGAMSARAIPNLMVQQPVRQKSLQDPSEFPTLGRPASAGVSGRINFVSAASKAPEEFSIQQEDFPALPGTQPAASAAPGAVSSTASLAASMPTSSAAAVSGAGGIGVPDGGAAGIGGSLSGSALDAMAPVGRSTVVYHPNGSVTGVPASMVRDQFGMIGLLSLIRVGEENPNFVIIAPGIDLNALGLPLNNTTDIFSCLGSPWAEQCLAKPQYIDYPVPQEYLISTQIREKQLPLPPPPLEQLQIETLFWLFYNCTCDHLQLSAAKELHRREWRWIKSEKLWVTRCQQNVDKLTAPHGERGFYFYWDTKTWTRQQKSLTIYYDQIDQSPCNYPDHHVSVGSTLGAAVPGAASGLSGAGGGVGGPS